MKIGPCACSDWLKAHGLSEYSTKHRNLPHYLCIKENEEAY